MIVDISRNLELSRGCEGIVTNMNASERHDLASDATVAGCQFVMTIRAGLPAAAWRIERVGLMDDMNME